MVWRDAPRVKRRYGQAVFAISAPAFQKKLSYARTNSDTSARLTAATTHAVHSPM